MRYPPPGRIVNGLHIWETGSSGPSVILEAGIASSCLGWALVQNRVAEFAHVYSYDRAGLGWSAPANTPRTLDNIVAELHTLLHAANVPSPYILAGHSFGGLVVQHFAAHHPTETAGLVLVDPVRVADWVPLSGYQKARLARGVKLSRRGALLARMGIVRLALALLMQGSRTLPKLFARATAGNGASVAERLAGEVRKLPREVWPLVQMHWSHPKSFLAMADYLESLPTNAAAMKPAHDVPTVLLANRRSHWIQLDEPDLVIDAIRDLAYHKTDV